MKTHLLWFGAFLLALASTLYCFHLHEERHRFIVIGNLDNDNAALVIMFDRKIHKSCLVMLDAKASRPDLCGQ